MKPFHVALKGLASQGKQLCVAKAIGSPRRIKRNRKVVNPVSKVLRIYIHRLNFIPRHTKAPLQELWHRHRIRLVPFTDHQQAKGSNPKEIAHLLQREEDQRRKMRRLNATMRRLKVETKELRKDQENIKRGQMEVREKFEAIQFECEQLRKETELITKQSLNTQLRLGLMFHILRARETNDFNKAATLTQVLRALIAKQNNQ